MNHALSAQRAKLRARQRSFAALELNYVVPEPYAEEEAPFDPPPIDDIFGAEDDEDIGFILAPPIAEVEEEEGEMCPAPEPVIAIDRPLPAISIFAGWDRPDSETLMRELAADPRLKRAVFAIQRGGIDAAISQANADLFLLDTTLDSGAMLTALDRLRETAANACIVILGAVNDIGLLRELSFRGVSDYIVPPAKADDIAKTLCALFAETDSSRTIAVIGARGGLGASTIARNVAWSIAERQQQKTTLIDLDLSFGADANAEFSVVDVLGANDCEEALDRALSQTTPWLNVLSAPKATQSLEIEPFAFDTLIANVRRTAAFTILDLPHAWEPWVRKALREADEIVIVAAPDLASLRNADNMLKLLRSERDKQSAPIVVMSMSGLPKRPEIPLKDFADALKVMPALTFAFEPELFAAAEADGKMIYEVMPDAKAALQLDLLASTLTGHNPIATLAVGKTETKPEPLPVLELVTPAPQPQRRVRSKQKVARTGYIALQHPLPRKRGARGLVRTLAAVVTLTIAGVWFVGHQTASTSADWPSAFSA